MTPATDWRAQRDTFLTNYYAFLEGATCTGFKLREDPDGGDPWPVLTFEKEVPLNVEIADAQATVLIDTGGNPRAWKVTFEVEVSRDEEGNGAGFLFGLPVPEATS